MRNRGPFSSLRILASLLLLAAVILTTIQLARFSRVRSNLPSGMKIAGVNVGGETRQVAAQRLLEAYSDPIILRYSGSEIHLDPSVIDFNLELENMLAAADVERLQKPFWEEFWDYLWARSLAPPEIPLSASYSEKRLVDYLSDLGQRYNQLPQPPVPLPGTVNFSSGIPGKELDIDGSILLIENALDSLTKREVDLPLKRTDPPRPDFRNLEILLKQTLDSTNPDNLAGVYLKDLQSGQEIHFARKNGNDIPVEPDIAFTASSIIKIPIMASSFRRIGDSTDTEAQKLMSDMIELSGNEAADWLMERVIDPNLGPLAVSEDMTALGLENTFLAGEFTFGSPLLRRFDTPANSRTDINTDPDPYSQTTPSDIGMLLEDIYQCSTRGGGSLTAVFPGEITQTECQMMIDLLVNNRLPVLITAGIPEGTKIAHKHGWVTTNGIINTIGDAGIIFSPGGNLILVVFLHNPDQLLWDPSSELIAILSQAVFNYYNPPPQSS